MNMKSFSIRMGLFFVVIAILYFSLYLIYKPEKDTQSLYFYSYSGKFEGIVEIEGKTSYDGKYYLTVSDFNPIGAEFSDYLSQFQDPEIAFKHIVLTKDTYIFDHRTTPGKIITMEDIQLSLFTSSDHLQFKFYIDTSDGFPYLVIKVLELY